MARIMAFLVFVFIHWAYQEKDVASFFADSEHSYYRYFHTSSLRKGVFFFKFRFFMNMHT